MYLTVDVFWSIFVDTIFLKIERVDFYAVTGNDLVVPFGHALLISLPLFRFLFLLATFMAIGTIALAALDALAAPGTSVTQTPCLDKSGI